MQSSLPPITRSFSAIAECSNIEICIIFSQVSPTHQLIFVTQLSLLFITVVVKIDRWIMNLVSLLTSGLLNPCGLGWLYWFFCVQFPYTFCDLLVYKNTPISHCLIDKNAGIYTGLRRSGRFFLTQPVIIFTLKTKMSNPSRRKHKQPFLHPFTRLATNIMHDKKLYRKNYIETRPKTSLKVTTHLSAVATIRRRKGFFLLFLAWPVARAHHRGCPVLAVFPPLKNR